MGKYYSIGLQTGKKAAEAVDAFIAERNKDDSFNFNPDKKKTLSDGSTTYQWCDKWQQSWSSDVTDLVKTLEQQFDDEQLENITSEDSFDVVYKLITLDDEGGQDEHWNEPGYEYFSDLCFTRTIIFPREFEDPFPGRSAEEILKSHDEDNYVEGYIRIYVGDLIDNDREAFLDQISEELVGSPLLMDITYEVAGVEQDNMLVLKVRGDASSIIDETEGGAA